MRLDHENANYKIESDVLLYVITRKRDLTTLTLIEDDAIEFESFLQYTLSEFEDESEAIDDICERTFANLTQTLN